HVTIRHRNGHFRNVTYLCRQVTGHLVHRVCQVFPGTSHTGHIRLTTELTFRTHLARHTRYFRCKSAELVHHRVDRVLQLEDLTTNVHRDLSRQITIRYRCRYLGDITHLRGQVTRHFIY